MITARKKGQKSGGFCLFLFVVVVVVVLTCLDCFY